MEKETVERLKGIVGEEYVADKDYDLIAYSRAWSYEGPLKPDVVVVPASAEEVSLVFRLANERGIPVVVRAGGTTTTGMALPRHGGIVLDLNRMDRIYGIDEDAQA
ncbi:MAG: FAD-binding oxidoreductase, partial [Dehalococcoidia bacterium]